MCGQTVLQKAMIPVLAGEGPGIGYLCVPCARQLVATTVPGPTTVARATVPGAGATVPGAGDEGAGLGG